MMVLRRVCVRSVPSALDLVACAVDQQERACQPLQGMLTLGILWRRVGVPKYCTGQSLVIKLGQLSRAPLPA